MTTRAYTIETCYWAGSEAPRWHDTIDRYNALGWARARWAVLYERFYRFERWNETARIDRILAGGWPRWWNTR